MVFFGSRFGAFSSLVSTSIVLLIVILGIVLSLVISKVLSHTLLKGEPSSFVLELPPYRKPQIGKVLVRSIFDRTLFVLRKGCRSCSSNWNCYMASGKYYFGWLYASYFGGKLLRPFCKAYGA